jgi:hypothetical protein
VRDVRQKEGYIHQHGRRVKPFTRTIGRLIGQWQYNLMAAFRSRKSFSRDESQWTHFDIELEN